MPRLPCTLAGGCAPAVYPSGRMCACRVPQRADVRLPCTPAGGCAPALMHHVAQSPPLSRGRDGCRCGPGPGLVLAAPCLPHALSFVLDVPSSVWTHALLSPPPRGHLSAAQTLVSPPAGRSLLPSALSALASVKLLSSALRPRCLSSSLCLPQLRLFDRQVFFQSWVYQTFGLGTPSKLKIPKNFLFMKVVSMEF